MAFGQIPNGKCYASEIISFIRTEHTVPPAVDRTWLSAQNTVCRGEKERKSEREGMRNCLKNNTPQ